METVESILHCWLGAATGDADVIREKYGLWWKKQPAADTKIRLRFEQRLVAQMRGEHKSWGDGTNA